MQELKRNGRPTVKKNLNPFLIYKISVSYTIHVT